MRALLLGLAAPLAAIAAPAAPASAQPASDPGVASGPGASVAVHRGNGERHDRRAHRRFPTTLVVGNVGWNGDWALNNNRSWEPDSFNDWWHERPSRAYPRWFQNNGNCDRLWWGGGVWRCGW